MPTYVYKFVDTGETIEVVQSFTDATLTEAVHPGTGATMPVKKVFTPVGVTFKGGGFYKTDSRNGSSSKSSAPAGDAASSSGTESAPTTSSESSSSAAPPSTAPSSTPPAAPAKAAS